MESWSRAVLEKGPRVKDQRIRKYSLKARENQFNLLKLIFFCNYEKNHLSTNVNQIIKKLSMIKLELYT